MGIIKGAWMKHTFLIIIKIKSWIYLMLTLDDSIINQCLDIMCLYENKFRILLPYLVNKIF